MEELNKILKQTFGFENFREWQKEIIESVVNWNNTLVFMPTWWGKSLSYQIPWIYLEWIAIIISPLISLMKDQVDRLNSRWIKAELINSSITTSRKKEIFEEMQYEDCDIKFIYIAPERLNDSDFLKAVKNIKVSLVAIDEAHCISQWWHDFRPSYMKVKDFLEWMNVPIVALTATATEKVREDIIKSLKITKYNSFISGFDRKNLLIIVREISKKEEKQEKILEILEKTPWEWIIYCSSLNNTKEVYEFLLDNWIKAWIYTWEMNTFDRENNQAKFMNSELKVIVATNAFWMWIDKSNIRFVIHYNLPWSIENYYQEIWRAGRDWKNSYAIVLASYQDTKIQEFFIENTYPPKNEILDFYNYIYSINSRNIYKTYFEMSSESGIWNAMKVWNIIKIFEKYNILKKWVDWEKLDWFRWNWISLIEAKRPINQIPINFMKLNILKDQAYFRLEQIKKLLFTPSCRKKFILKYFWDEQDLKNIWDWCNFCDFCLEKDKLKESLWENFSQNLDLSFYEIILDTISDFDERFWVKFFVDFFVWAQLAKIFETKMNFHENFWIFTEYEKDFVENLIMALVSESFLFRTNWQYPVLWISINWKNALKNDTFLKNKKEDLDNFILSKTRKIFKKSSSEKVVKDKKESKKVVKWSTQEETLMLFKSWKSVEEIAKMRNLTIQTIEWHLLNMYERWRIPLNEIIKFFDLEKLKKIKKLIEENFSSISEIAWLWQVRTLFEEKWEEMDYSNIRACISFMKNRDL